MAAEQRRHEEAQYTVPISRREVFEQLAFLNHEQLNMSGRFSAVEVELRAIRKLLDNLVGAVAIAGFLLGGVLLAMIERCG